MIPDKADKDIKVYETKAIILSIAFKYILIYQLTSYNTSHSKDLPSKMSCKNNNLIFSSITAFNHFLENTLNFRVSHFNLDLDLIAVLF